jgi:hypothetical protein
VPTASCNDVETRVSDLRPDEPTKEVARSTYDIEYLMKMKKDGLLVMDFVKNPAARIPHPLSSSRSKYRI